MANKKVVLYRRVRIKKRWVYCKVAADGYDLAPGEYYLSWYEGKQKRLERVEGGLAAASAALSKKALELAYVAAGGEVKPKQSEVGESPQRTRVSKAIRGYLEDCADREGKSGYGLASRTPTTYEDRLAYLLEFRPDAYMDEIDDQFMAAFRRFLRTHRKDLSDRTCYNVVQAASTFLLRHGNSSAKRILKEMSFPPIEVVPYTREDLQKFFAACDEEEELLFKFFLHSMARDMEVAHCEVRDLKFDKNILHICPKPDRNFRLKGKRSGQAKKGRKVPMPSIFMARMQRLCEAKSPRELIFPNGKGGVQKHFLRLTKRIAKRAGLPNWKDFDLHRWRKTGATFHHEFGVSVRKLQAWLGHESLEVTLDYLGVEDAADEVSQEQVNSGALASFA